VNRFAQDAQGPSLSKLGAAVRTDDHTDGAVEAGIVAVPPTSVLGVLGVRLIAASVDHAQTETKVAPHLLNQRGSVQGGVYSVLADATAGWATEAHLGTDSYTTTAVSTQLVGAAHQGDLLSVTARIAHGGRRTIVATVTVTRRRPGVEDRVVALATCQQLVLQG
jgi:1,4-dihydroxy-2-naphthoyl-CoA hydrolase